MARQYHYDENGNWVYVGDIFIPDPVTPTPPAGGSTTTTTTPPAGGNNPAAKNTPKTTETAVKENFVLEGTVTLAITPETLSVKIGDTIDMQGFGKYLSGSYYVVSRNIILSSEGYQLLVDVMRKNFSRSLKK